jgi:hypothetical protein
MVAAQVHITHATTSRIENSAQVLSCQLMFVHEMTIESFPFLLFVEITNVVNDIKNNY